MNSFFKLSIIPRFNILSCIKFTIIMKFYKLIIFIGICMSMIKAQFTDISINIDYSNINENEMFIFENFEDEIHNYFMNNYFFDEKEELELTINITMIIESINNKGGEKIITAQIMFSNQKDIYLFSKSFDFAYNKSEALYKSEMFHPLASLLTCYAYMQLAYELDTYHYLGGNKYFIKAQNIASDGKSSMFSKNWQSRLKKIRRQSEDIIYRELRYNFFVTYDALEFDEEQNYKEALKFYANFYESILQYEEYYGYTKPLTQFLNAYNQEIVNLAKQLQYQEIIDYLLIYDEPNKHAYQKYYKN